MIKNSHPCILLLNDIHISKDNIPDFKLNWNEAISICMEKEISIICLGGDLFMSRSSQTLDTMLAVHDALLTAKSKGIRIVLANGNHDKVNQESIRGYCHIYDQHSNTSVADEWVTLQHPDWNFVIHTFAYFPESGSFIRLLNKLIENGLQSGKLNYLYLHEGINGVLSQATENELPTNIFKPFDKVFAGHYHNRCVIPGTNIEYIGSSRQMNFGEDEEKGYTILYTDGSQEFIKNTVNTRYQVIDVNVDKMGIHLTDRLEEVKNDGRYKVKVRVHSPSAKAQGIDKKVLLDAGANKVEIITEDPEIMEINSSSLFEKFDNKKIKDNYEQFCKEKNIPDVALGLSYLSKI